MKVKNNQNNNTKMFLKMHETIFASYKHITTAEP